MATITHSSTLGFELEMEYDEGFVEGDFVQVPGPEESKYVAQITHTETDDGHIEASASVIGSYPSLPFRQGTEVERADEDLVLETLSLPSSGIQIGALRSFGTPLYLSVEKFMEKQVGVFGRTGSGKSYTAGVLMEELFEYDQPMVIVDPHGEYASLKVKPDGEASDYRVVEYADLEFNSAADRDLDLDSIDPLDLARPGQATVLNLRGVDTERQEDIVATLLDALFLARKRDRIPATKVFLEEAHLFAPQRKNEPRSVIENIAKEGRKFGFTLTLISQRPSEIYPNIRAQLQAFTIHKLTDDTDIKKIIKSAEGLDSSWGTQIQKLQTGEVLFVGDVIASPTFVDVRERRTKHHEGSEGMFQTSDHARDAAAVDDRQTELDEEVTSATVARLKERIDELETERDRLRERLEQEQEGETNERIAELETTVDEQRKEIDELQSKIRDRETSIEELEAELEEREQQIREQRNKIQQLRAERDALGEGTSSSASSEADDGEGDILDHPYVDRVLARLREELAALDKYERGMLEFFLYNESGSIEDAYFHAGGSPNSSQRYEKAETLVEKNFIRKRKRGEYVYALDDLIEDKLNDFTDQGNIDVAIDTIEDDLTSSASK
ncbi:ATP-binding protein [Halorubrum aethiopicum]|uniref:ATP-binding protein n=1 Tax=Halorubrum aethiopicum TaxID=1758255 RepID=UPI000835B341|nr:ATP-binding protein [Halorubrum aethiopicum]